MKHTEYIIPIGEDAHDYDEMFIGVIRRQPELVRCKDCKHWNANNDTHRCFVWCVYTCGDGYCHRAERKEE